jgi:protein TonB
MTLRQAPPWRPLPLVLVAGLHVVALVGFLAASGIRERIRATPFLEVAFVRPEQPVPPPPPELFRPRLRDPLAVNVPVPEVPPVVVTRVEPLAAPTPAVPVAPAITAAVRSDPAPPAPPAPPNVEPPRFDMAYLRNPPPVYPSLSKRMKEHGRVILRVLVSADGQAESVEVRATSGSERLDRAALEAVRRWRFAPARRGAEAIAAYALVPILFSPES